MRTIPATAGRKTAKAGKLARPAFNFHCVLKIGG